MTEAAKSIPAQPVINHPKAQVAKLTMPRFRQDASFERTTRLAIPAAGTTMQQVLNPNYWNHVAALLRPLDRIEVIPEDMSFCMDLLVLSANRLEARMHVLSYSEIGAKVTDADMDVEADPRFEVKWGGPLAKYRVMRIEDKAVVRDKFTTRHAAEEWLRDYIKAANA